MSVTTLNGCFLEPKPPRIDFIKENKKQLKQISSLVSQRKTHSSLTSASLTRDTTQSNKRRIKSTGNTVRVHKDGNMAVFIQSKDSKTSSISNLSSAKATSRKSESSRSSKHQSSQTIDPERLDELFVEGKIIYPSSKVTNRSTERRTVSARNTAEKQSVKESTRLEAVESKDKKQKAEDTLSKGEDRRQKGENTLSKKVETDTHRTVVSVASTPKLKTPLNAGEIIRKTTEEHLKTAEPKDIRLTVSTKQERKKYRKQEKEKVVPTPAEDDPNCPPQHIPLPEEERIKTLEMLKESYAEMIKELNMLPVRTDTLRVRQRKIHLDQQLNKIEEGIKVFSKPKVYVKIEA